MDNNNLPDEYTPPIDRLCKWEEGDMKCNKKSEHKGYCEGHAKKLYPDYGLSAATGAGVAGLISTNPVGLAIGAVLGLALAAYIISKSK